MAIIDYFPASLAVNENAALMRGADAQVYALADTALATPLAITDLQGVPMASLRSSDAGIFPAFRVASGQTQIVVVSGQLRTPMTSLAEHAAAAETAASVAAGSAGAAADAAQAAQVARTGAEQAVQAAAGLVWMGTAAEYNALPSAQKNVSGRAYFLFGGTVTPGPGTDPGPVTPTHEWIAKFAQADGPAAATFDTGQAWLNESPAGQTFTVTGGVLFGSADGALRVSEVGPAHRVGVRPAGTMHTTNSNPTIVLGFDPTQTTNSEWQYRVQVVANGTVSIYVRTPGQSTLWASASGVWALGKEISAEMVPAGSTVVLKVYVDGVEVTPAGGVVHSGVNRPSGRFAGIRVGAGSGGLTYGYDEIWMDKVV